MTVVNKARGLRFYIGFLPETFDFLIFFGKFNFIDYYF
jgi:hypothetical protein